MLGLGLVLGGIGAIGNIFASAQQRRDAKREKLAAEAKEEKARREMTRLKGIYSSLDTSNPYLNMENKFEDLTVNQAQAQFESQQFQQSQANILDSLKGAAGGGGVAALAQSLAQQGQLAAQKSAVSIGQQEQANQMKERTEASRLDTLERQGVEKSRTMERDKYATLLGMSQQETAGYRDERLAWQQQQQSATANLFSSVTDLGTGLLNTMTG
tara:strand:- start:4555 stop:5196 length:642 start_codon:yes stop_codon:yes gene_type:complete